MQALELMKTHVVKTTPDSTIGEAVDLMDLYQVSGLPVVDAEGVLCGVLTEQDVLRAMLTTRAARANDALCAGEASHPAFSAQAANALPTRDYMSTPAQSVSEHDDALAAAHLLLTHNRKFLPVVDQNRRVVGMLYRIDVLQAVFEGLLP